MSAASAASGGAASSGSRSRMPGGTCIAISRAVRLWQVDDKPGVEAPQLSMPDEKKLRQIIDVLPGAVPLVTFAINGRARAGKSTTMNYALAWLLKNAYAEPVSEDSVKHTDGSKVEFEPCKVSGARVPSLFETSDSVQPCTRGADGVFVHLPKGAFGQTTDIVVLLIDCEGSGAEAKERDNRTVLPALVLSARGALICAQRDAITRNAALDMLSPIVQMSRLIHDAAIVAAKPAGAATASEGQVLGTLSMCQVMSNLDDAKLEELRRHVFEDERAPLADESEEEKRNKQRRDLRSCFRRTVMTLIPPVAMNSKGEAYPENQEDLRFELDRLLSGTLQHELQSTVTGTLMDRADMPCVPASIVPVIQSLAQQTNKTPSLTTINGGTLREQLLTHADHIASEWVHALADDVCTAVQDEKSPCWAAVQSVRSHKSAEAAAAVMANELRRQAVAHAEARTGMTIGSVPKNAEKVCKSAYDRVLAKLKANIDAGVLAAKSYIVAGLNEAWDDAADAVANSPAMAALRDAIPTAEQEKQSHGTSSAAQQARSSQAKALEAALAGDSSIGRMVGKTTRSYIATEWAGETVQGIDEAFEAEVGSGGPRARAAAEQVMRQVLGDDYEPVDDRGSGATGGNTAPGSATPKRKTPMRRTGPSSGAGAADEMLSAGRAPPVDSPAAVLGAAAAGVEELSAEARRTQFGVRCRREDFAAVAAAWGGGDGGATMERNVARAEAQADALVKEARVALDRIKRAEVDAAGLRMSEKQLCAERERAREAEASAAKAKAAADEAKKEADAAIKKAKEAAEQAAQASQAQMMMPPMMPFGGMGMGGMGMGGMGMGGMGMGGMDMGGMPRGLPIGGPMPGPQRLSYNAWRTANKGVYGSRDAMQAGYRSYKGSFM